MSFANQLVSLAGCCGVSGCPSDGYNLFMPLRPREHVLETESRRRFENTIPAEWITRTPSPDYGVDFEITLVQDGRVTNQVFGVQIKATDTIKPSNKKASFSFERERIEYYLEQKMPIMLVLFDAHNNRLFFQWTHHWYNSNAELNHVRVFNSSQETISILFQRLLTAADEAMIVRDVRHFMNFSNPLAVRGDVFRLNLHAETEAEKRIRDAFIQSLRFDRAGQITRFDSTELEDDAIRIEFADGALSLSGAEDAMISTHDGSDHHFVKLCCDYLYLLLALALVRCGRFVDGVDLVSHYVFSKRTIDHTTSQWLASPDVLSLYTRLGRQSELIDLADAVSQFTDGFLANFFTFSVRNAPNHFKQIELKYRRLLDDGLKREVNRVGRGTIEYNIANSLRRAGDYRAAFKHYARALRQNRAYATMSHWYSEVGLTLFHLGRFRFAELCYKTAVSMQEAYFPVQGLLGDALFFQGKFDEARLAFEADLVESVPLADAVRKTMLIRHYQRSFAQNQSLTAGDDALPQPGSDDGQVKALKALRRTVQSNPLDASAWRRLADATGEVLHLAWADALEPDCDTWLRCVRQLLPRWKQDDSVLSDLEILAVVAQGLAVFRYEAVQAFGEAVANDEALSSVVLSVEGFLNDLQPRFKMYRAPAIRFNITFNVDDFESVSFSVEQGFR
jgi:tetratricopeptide (TPR) repeat protein